MFGLPIEVLPDKERPHRHAQVSVDVGDTELPAGWYLLPAIEQAVELILNSLKSTNGDVTLSRSATQFICNVVTVCLREISRKREIFGKTEKVCRLKTKKFKVFFSVS